MLIFVRWMYVIWFNFVSFYIYFLKNYKKNWSILSAVANIINICLYQLQEGVFVHGMFLDGAGWDRRNLRLCESTLKVLYTALPVVHVYAINSTAPKDPKLYQVCSYVYVKRFGVCIKRHSTLHMVNYFLWLQGNLQIRFIIN